MRVVIKCPLCHVNVHENIVIRHSA
jgi:hypothetical protein